MIELYIILQAKGLNDTDLSQPHRRGIRRGLVPLYLTGSSSRRQLGPHTWSTDIEQTKWQLVLVVVQSILHGFCWPSLPSNLPRQQSWNTVLIYQSYRNPQIHDLMNFWKTDNVTMKNWPTQIKMIPEFAYSKDTFDTHLLHHY